MKRMYLAVLVLASMALSAAVCGAPAASSPPTEAAQPGGSDPTTSTGAQPTAEVASSAGGDVDPCALFNQQAAETLFGGPAQAGTGGGQTYQNSYSGSCTYNSADNTQVAIMNLTRNEAAPPPAERFALISGPVIQPVSGLGDAALWDGDRATLNAAKGPWTVSLTAALTGGASATLDQLTPIAQQIVA